MLGEKIFYIHFETINVSRCMYKDQENIERNARGVGITYCPRRVEETGSEKVIKLEKERKKIEMNLRVKG